MARTIKIYDGTQWVEIGGGSGGGATIISNTYANIRALRDSNQLQPGAWYRITDYAPTQDTHASFKMGGHQFDIIVQAISNHELDGNNAVATWHDKANETYFDVTKCDLSSWKIRVTFDKSLVSANVPEYLRGTGEAKPSSNYPAVPGYYEFMFYYAGSEIPMYSATQYPVQGADVWTYRQVLANFFSVDDSTLESFGIPAFCNAPETIAMILYAQTGEQVPVIFQWNYFGVWVTEMEDEHHNHCGYDFKNVMYYISMWSEWATYKYFGNNETLEVGTLLDAVLFKFNFLDQTKAYYTFSYIDTEDNNTLYEASVKMSDLVDHQISGNDLYASAVYALNQAVALWFLDEIDVTVKSNTIGEDCIANSFGKNCNGNTLYKSCDSNSFGVGCLHNILFDNCNGNSFDSSCSNNIFGTSCMSNTFSFNCQKNVFGNDCQDNEMKHYFNGNSFGNDCNSNTFNYSFEHNILGNQCSNNTFGYVLEYNSLGNNCQSNNFGNSCNGISLGNYCISNTFGVSNINISLDNGCSSNTFGNNCSGISFGNTCNNNTFGNNCTRILFGNACYTNTFGSYCMGIVFTNYNMGNTITEGYAVDITLETGCSYLAITSADTVASNVNLLKHVHIHEGVTGGTNSLKTISIPDRELTYSTEVYATGYQVMTV